MNRTQRALRDAGSRGISPCSRSGSFHFGQGNTEEGAVHLTLSARACSHPFCSSPGSPTWGCWPLTNQRSLELEDRATDTKVMHGQVRGSWVGVSSLVGQKVSLLRPAFYVPRAHLRCLTAAGAPHRLPNPHCPSGLDKELTFSKQLLLHP
ncbi:hypothetical protein mRhiFer1_009803 [Rhinolophus ferrumequinum]|uniref:Uncharacterized protein n=1 Tax=Rhinolophus ferrumequinum TaxID=59479 RepID=A0A7J7YRZ8_RHIFE|nr:hypothetical protein mRhiFer1_009803 [Rhinolophus ferrumequinum]